MTEEQISRFHCCFLQNADFNFFFDRFNSDVIEPHCSFPLFSLIKLNYSLLTASDYLATAHYMNQWKEMLLDFGEMDENLKRRIIYNAETLKPYNKEAYEAISRGIIMNPDNNTEQNNANLNALRQSIAMEVIENVRIHSDKSLFYIEAPTGSGKTNVSMLALAEILRSNNSNTISKVFYVFPFTTLITQTYKSLCETLGLDVGEIAEIHSRAPFKTGSYDDDYLNYLDNLFMNYPVLLLSHVRFFDVLKTNSKEINYLLHRMANSVVIIDEIQSYSPKIWNKIIYFIANYAKAFNMKFIVMSATLPKIGEIIDNKDLASDFVYLVTDKKKYFQNPNFCNRVHFNFSLLSDMTIPLTPDDKIIYLERLSKSVIEKSEEYASMNSSYPNSVFTIIEFIFKRTASEFYSLIRSLNNFFDEVLLLSGTILEPRRKQIIYDLKSGEKRKKRILLISTQVVEAGVDIDMDLGFKDKSIIDSEEQLAGRINRNVLKKDCELYIFNCDSEKELYSGDERYKIMRNLGVEYERILKDKDFDKLYNQIIKQIITQNGNMYIENITDLMQATANLSFRYVNNALKLIESPSISVFVPMLIDTQYFNDYRSILEEFHISYEETVSGEAVWNSYTSIIQNQDEDFVKNKIQMKKIQSLMSNFTFSIFPNSIDYKTLETYGYEKYGYFYLKTYKDVYSYEDGINTTILSTSQYL
ncbi:MAG: CRISPR-associated helicase Cas3' [Bacteroidales bacterium]|nr:CRISPR-associated helicase Cas3' [Bacteroidales bacterium]